jgi:hypothetical protein
MSITPEALQKLLDELKDGVRMAIMDRKTALTELVHEIKEYRRLAEQKPLTLQGSDYAHVVQELKRRLIAQKGCCDREWVLVPFFGVVLLFSAGKLSVAE